MAVRTCKPLSRAEEGPLVDCCSLACCACERSCDGQLLRSKSAVVFVVAGEGGVTGPMGAMSSMGSLTCGSKVGCMGESGVRGMLWLGILEL